MTNNRRIPIDCQPELPARFWGKVRKTRTCWEWTGGKSSGYGLFWWKGSTVAAHRLAYAALVGKIADDKELDHKCRNRACVNPQHLAVVTHRENVLAGANFTAANARLVCCPKGHPYEVVTRPKGGTQRRCRVCRNERALARYHERMREARRAKWAARWAGL